MAATRGTVRALTRNKASEKSITKNALAVQAAPPIASGAAAKRVAVVVGRRMKQTIRVLSAGAKGGPGKTFLWKHELESVDRELAAAVSDDASPEDRSSIDR